MNYDIKIIGETFDNGTIEFDRLASLTKTTKDIATKALMLKLKGYSQITPDKRIKEALKLRLEKVFGGKNKGTSLTIDCDHFKDTIKGIQTNMFNSPEEVAEMTPMSLVIHSFRAALNLEDSMDLDRPLLKSLMSFKKNFESKNEIIFLSNRGTIPEVELTKETFQKISLLEESIPDPQNVLVSGQLDEIKVSKGRLGLETKDGIVNLMSGNIELDDIFQFIGKKIKVKGLAHFKVNGQISYIEISDYSSMGEKDAFFSSTPNAYNLKQQILFKESNKKKITTSLQALQKLAGLMNEELDDQQLHSIIKDLHK